MAAKGKLVLDTEQYALSLLRYWAEHDRVVRQVYNSLCDLDEALWSCTLEMCEEVRDNWAVVYYLVCCDGISVLRMVCSQLQMGHIRDFRQMVRM